MTTAYSPAPGTVAYRALAHLETLDRGAELSSAQLAEAINAPAAVIQPSMVAPLRAGMVFSRQKGGHQRSPMFWSLVDHQAASHAKPEAPAPARAAQSHAEPAAHRNARPAGAIPAGDGSQKPDDAAAIPGARAGSNTPQQGANRDASAGQSHVAGGSASPAGRGADGPTARGAAPDLSTATDEWASYKQRCEHGVRWENRCVTCDATDSSKRLKPSAAVEKQEVSPAPAAPSRRGLRIAAWSTGELALELADGEVIVFGTAEANQIYSFCRRIGGGA